MNNFHSAMAIAAGLNVGAITRLERTWAIVPSASKASFGMFQNTNPADS